MELSADTGEQRFRSDTGEVILGPIIHLSQPYMLESLHCICACD